MVEETTSPTVVEYASADPAWLPRWEVYALAIGDLITLIIFAVVGRTNHGVPTTQGPVLDTLNTAGPFFVAWIVTALALRLYRGTALYPLGRVIWRTALAGVIAGPLGVLLRIIWREDLIILPQFWTFMLMATLFSTLFLLIWRVGWSRLRRLWWSELP